MMALALVSAVGVAYAAYEALTLRSAWSSVERVDLDEPTAPSSTVPGHTVEDRPAPGPPVAGVDPPDTDPDLLAPPRSDETPATDSTAQEPYAPPGSQPTVAGTDPGSSSSTPSSSSATPPSSSPSSTSSASTSSTSSTSPASSTSSASSEPEDTILRQAEQAPEVLALVGSDSRSGLEDLSDFGDFGGQRADVIMLAVRSEEDLRLLSVPRDLYVEDSCSGGRHRIGHAYAGCGDRHGLAHLVGELEQLTGLPIDHAAAVDLAGFQSVVDALGGYRICTDHPLRDGKSGLELKAGCQLADGETTLAWLRSRHTERRVNGRWEPMGEVSDLTRNDRQRRFVLDLFDRLAQRSGPGAILDALRSAAPHLTLDDELSVRDAAAWIWQLRNSEIDTDQIPVTHHTTSDGAAVLVPERDLQDLAADLTS